MGRADERRVKGERENSGLGAGSASIEMLEDRTLFAAVAAPAGVEFDAPVTITHGGTYTGNWQSLDADVPAVNIKTTEPVIIRDSTIASRSDLIKASILEGADVTILNTCGYGLNPNVAGEVPGRFLRAEHFSNVEVRNCTMRGTSGMNLYHFTGSVEAGDGVRIIRNRAIDIDGRKSDGAGGFVKFDERERLSDGREEKGYERVQFVQLNQVKDVPNVVIAWNEIRNRPGRSRVEDNISIYCSSGTAQSPIRINDNYIEGAYNVKPWKTDYVKGNYAYTFDYSGGGIMLGDGDGCAYVRAFRNQVVSTTNYGIAIYAGHDMEFFDNRVVSAGVLKDGRTIAHGNVGVYIWDGQHDGASKFYNNSAHDNVIGWYNDEHDRNDWWIPSATSFENNEHWSGPVTLQAEAEELLIWKSKRTAQRLKVGA